MRGSSNATTVEWDDRSRGVRRVGKEKGVSRSRRTITVRDKRNDKE